MGLQNLECALARESNVEQVLFFCGLAFFILPINHLLSIFIGSSSCSNFTLFINALSYLFKFGFIYFAPRQDGKK